MVIVDTSVWINHFNNHDNELEHLLQDMEVMLHTFIMGELACGNMKKRQLVFRLLGTLPLIKSVDQNEFLHFIEEHKLYGAGLGFVDVHILASAYLSKISIYTFDKTLAFTANRLGLLYH